MNTKNNVDTPQDMKTVTRIALFANHLPGLRTAEFLSSLSSNDEIVALYLTGENAELDSKIINAVSLPEQNIFIGKDVIKNQSHVTWLKKQKVDTIICVYWPWLLHEDIFSMATTTINFHPAMLPINRGWFPHVHSLIDGSKTGVTIHKIETGADTGDIWAQREVPIHATDTAKDVYDRLQNEIVLLFKEKWGGIKSGRIQALPQNHDDAIYHSKSEIEHLDKIDLNATYKGGDLINRLRARTFGNRGFAFFEADGKKTYINIKLSESNKFD